MNVDLMAPVNFLPIILMLWGVFSCDQSLHLQKAWNNSRKLLWYLTLKNISNKVTDTYTYLVYVSAITKIRRF